MTHPDPRVRAIAQAMDETLASMYPHDDNGILTTLIHDGVLERLALAALAALAALEPS